MSTETTFQHPRLALSVAASTVRRGHHHPIPYSVPSWCRHRACDAAIPLRKQLPWRTRVAQARGGCDGSPGGHQHWLASMRASLSGAVTEKDFTRILAGGRDDGMRSAICRWDFECERQHAYRARDTETLEEAAFATHSWHLPLVVADDAGSPVDCWAALLLFPW